MIYLIEQITQEKASLIIETRKPLGLFWLYEEGHGGCYVGIDNSTGDAWTEEFKSFAALKDWLNGGELNDEP